MKLNDLSEAPAPITSEPAAIRLGAWNYYFIAKFVLLWRGLIDFHPLENLAFVAVLLVPIASPVWRRVKLAIAIPVAVGLLYYDSWFPAFDRVLSQASLLTHFSPSYLFELVGRFVSWPVLTVLVISCAAVRIAGRYIRVGFLICIALIVLALPGFRHSTPTQTLEADLPKTAGVIGAGDSLGLDGALNAFYAKESQRSVRFSKAEGSAPFDIIFIQICSMSWDDLQSIGMDKHPLWSSFDFVFRHFNSAASYSGPAAIRINRATCGQTSHQALYAPVSDQCLLMPSLKQSGFETNLALNHDGHFDNFLSLIRRQGIAAPLTSFDGLAVAERSFDDSPVYDDLAVLSRWFDTRQKSNSDRVALFYNTITLHDGNRVVSGPAASLSSLDSYKPRVEKLFSDLNAFMEQIQKSGRRAIVVVVPEHGAARRGDKFQVAGLREIATPAITLVPVGVRVIGANANRQGEAAQIDASISYLGLSQLIANLIEKPPYGDGFNPTDYVANLPTTDYVSENEGATMITQGGKYYLKLERGGWQEYAADVSQH